MGKPTRANLARIRNLQSRGRKNTSLHRHLHNHIQLVHIALEMILLFSLEMELKTFLLLLFAALSQNPISTATPEEINNGQFPIDPRPENHFVSTSAQEQEQEPEPEPELISVETEMIHPAKYTELVDRFSSDSKSRSRPRPRIKRRE